MMWRKVLRRKLARRRRGALTIMAIPATDGTIRSISIPLLLVYMGSAVAVAVIAFLVLSYFGMTATVARFYHDQVAKDAHIEELTKKNAELEQINADNKKQLETFAKRTAELEKELARLDALSKEITSIIKGKKVSSTATSTTTLASRGDYQRGAAPGEDREVDLESDPAAGLAQLAVETDSRLADLARAADDMAADLSSLRRSAVSYREKLDHTPDGWPARGRITSSFGRRRHPITRNVQPHDGVDIAAPVGTPIRATADGTVRFAGTQSGYGLMVIIEHGYGFQTVYAHNSRNVVRAGQRVKRGQVIAYVGSTGTSTGPHVHYEVRVSGKPANPRNYM
ncbi:MAG TPA: peptidoglycan DD-metalloendopeptidase family protein [Firmicutes bacterium]|nr:peptidoglycan DD-metalloendopeptidase family protein [Bacillota bacterium]